MCKRAWVAGYVFKDKQPQSEAMAFGEKAHKLLEVYAQTGQVPDDKQPWQFPGSEKVRFPGLSARKAMKHVPGPGIGRAEHGFGFVLKGVKFVGYIDREWQEENDVWITDYKFTSSYQSALSPEDLAQNSQAIIYAVKTMIEKKVKEVNLHWVYTLSTKNPTSRAVTTKITEAQAKNHFQHLLKICEEMIALREDVQKQLDQGVAQNEILNSLPPTVESCSRYAGCYYIDRCNLTPEQMMEGAFSDMTDLNSKLTNQGLDKFIKKKAAETPAPPPPPTNNKPAPATTTTTTTKPDLSKFVKKPEVHQTEDKKPAPVVPLNAPEHYASETPSVTPEEQEVLGSLTSGEKAVILKVIGKLLDRL
jgi:hypothetical protein